MNFWATEDLIKAVSDTIAREKQERIYNNQDPIDYGYSFAGVNIIRQSCLESVRNFCEIEGRPAVVADLGAGFGNMTWKLLAAGAQVDAFELKDTAVQSIQKRIKALNPAYWQGQALDTILKVFPVNILIELNKKEFREKYDFIWIGNVFHFLTPAEIQLITKQLQLVMKPGAKVFVETNSIESFLNQSMENEHFIVNAVERAKQKKIEFPGFIAFNSATIINHSIGQVVRLSHISAFDQQEMASLSIPTKTNGYGKGILALSSLNDESKKILHSLSQACNSTMFFMTMNVFYQITNLLNEVTAKKVFKQAGFNNIQTTKRNIQDPRHKHQGLNILAQKPFILKTDDKEQYYQERDEGYGSEAISTRVSLLVDENPTRNFRRPYSFTMFAPKVNAIEKMPLFSLPLSNTL